MLNKWPWTLTIFFLWKLLAEGNNILFYFQFCMWLQGIMQVHALIIIIKVVLKCKIVFTKTVLSAYTHTHIHTHTHTKHTDYTKFNLHNLKQAANRNLSHTKPANLSVSLTASCLLQAHTTQMVPADGQEASQAGCPAWEWTLTWPTAATGSTPCLYSPGPWWSASCSACACRMARWNRCQWTCHGRGPVECQKTAVIPILSKARKQLSHQYPSWPKPENSCHTHPVQIHNSCHTNTCPGQSQKTAVIPILSEVRKQLSYQFHIRLFLSSKKQGHFVTYGDAPLSRYTKASMSMCHLSWQYI